MSLPTPHPATDVEPGGSAPFEAGASSPPTPEGDVPPDSAPAESGLEADPPPPKPELKGIKIGPFIFVPEWSAVQGPDPWAHRKGEPRMLTLFWTIFLLAASGVTLFGTRSAGLVRAVQYQISARRLLLIVAFAAAVLWPMVRLCQQPPERSIGRSILLDVLGLSVPVAAVLLPLPFLTGWGWPLLSVVWFVIAGWALVSVSIAHLALTDMDRIGGPRRPLRRVAAMTCVLAIVVGGAWLGFRAAPDSMGWAASPLSHVHRLTTGLSGLAPRPTEPDARAVVLLWVAGLGLALWAALAGRR